MLQGKVCLITGGGRGIGQAMALRLTLQGAQTLVTARSADQLAETRRLCESHRGVCEIEPADLERPEEAERVVQRCRERFGRLDILVNNAGVAPLAPLEQTTTEDFERVLRLNIGAVFYMCRAAWGLLKDSHGVIVNLSSMASVDPFPGFVAYGASKSWVNAFTSALANEGRAAGVRVYALAPGAVDTPLLRKTFPDFPASGCLTPAEVAEALEWLLDDRCRYTSGQTIFVRK